MYAKQALFSTPTNSCTHKTPTNNNEVIGPAGYQQYLSSTISNNSIDQNSEAEALEELVAPAALNSAHRYKHYNTWFIRHSNSVLVSETNKTASLHFRLEWRLQSISNDMPCQATARKEDWDKDNDTKIIAQTPATFSSGTKHGTIICVYWAMNDPFSCFSSLIYQNHQPVYCRTILNE